MENNVGLMLVQTSQVCSDCDKNEFSAYTNNEEHTDLLFTATYANNVGSPGRVVTEGDLLTRGHEFESLDWYFFA